MNMEEWELLHHYGDRLLKAIGGDGYVHDGEPLVCNGASHSSFLVADERSDPDRSRYWRIEVTMRARRV
jgi:hypothetical protein